ncbi:ankyrin repeat-containing domain protein [Aspergillus californicus]
MSSFLDLPEEIILGIANACTKKTLASFVVTSQKCLRICHEALYNLSLPESQRAMRFAASRKQEQTMLYVLPNILEAIKNAETLYERSGIAGDALVDACQGGSHKAVRSLLDAGAPPDFLSRTSSTRFMESPLRAAAGIGHVEIMITLLNAGATASGLRDEASPLMAAVRGSHLEAVSLLILHGVEPKHDTVEGPPWVEAGRFGDVKIIQALLDAGADVNEVDRYTSTLIEAANAGHVDAVELLLNRGANPSQESGRPLMEAARRGHYAVVEKLLKAGADPNKKKNNAAPLGEAGRYGHVEIMTLLLDAGARANLPKISPLAAVVMGGNLRAVQMMRDAGAYVNDEVLQTAAHAGRVDILDFLLPLGLNGRGIDDLSRAGFSDAARAGRISSIQVLLAYKGDVNKLDEDGRSLLSHAAMSGKETLVDILLRAGARTDQDTPNYAPLVLACSDGHHYMVNSLLKHGANVDQVNRAGQSPLSLAASRSRGCKSVRIVKALLDHNANIHTVDRQQRTALSWAAIEGNTDIIQLLLEAGANVNHADQDGNTPLLLCIATQEAVEKLLQSGADVNAVDRTGCSALMNAARSHRETIVQLLLNHGAKVDQAAQHGRTAVVYAAFRAEDHRQSQVFDMLIAAGCNLNVRDTSGKCAQDYLHATVSTEVRNLLAPTNPQS